MLLLARAVQSAAHRHRLHGLDRHRVVAAATLGVVLFDEPSSAALMGFITLIVVGVAGLNVTAY